MILSFDPGLTTTGFAILSSDGKELLDHGVINPDCDGDAYSRAASIASLAVLEVRSIRDKLTTVVVESPQTYTKGKGNKRSLATLPNYGIAVGVITYAIDMEIKGTEIVLLRPSASSWTRGFARTKGDEHKTGRVLEVEDRFKLERGSLGPKTVAGNVADAVLLGCWAAEANRGSQ